MLKKLKIQNFKSHLDTELNLSNLNVFTGINGTGKSSVIQALLLLRQSHEKSMLNKGLSLNKPLCEIGFGEDAIHQYSDDEFVAFAFEDTNSPEKPEWHFRVESNDLSNDFLPILETKDNADTLEKISLFNTNFQYLSAERWSAKAIYAKKTYEVEHKRQLSQEGGQGELVAHFLEYYGGEQVTIEGIRHPLAAGNTLLEQCNGWLKEISSDVNAVIKNTGTDYEIRYSFTVKDNLPTAEFRAKNVGFGITYTLSILVAILSARKDSLIIIENPEAHIHPYGQAKLIELICRAAQNGVQFIVETHSDHIINGIAVAAKKFGKDEIGIKYDKVRIFYFDREETMHNTIVKQVDVDSNGRIKNAPVGFFDQFNKDLRTLMSR